MFGTVDHVLAQRVRKSIKKRAGFEGGLGPRPVLGNQMVTAQRNIVAGRAPQVEGQRRFVEAGLVGQHKPREQPEAPPDAVELRPRVGKLQAQSRVNVLIKVLEQRAAGVFEPGADLLVELGPQRLKGGVDLVGRAALLADGEDALFEIDARLDGAQHLVAGAEHAVEELELFRKQFEHAAVGGVALVEKVDDHHVVLLAVAMAAADALFDALGVPGQVVIEHQRAELQVDAFGRRLGGQQGNPHDLQAPAKHGRNDARIRSGRLKQTPEF